MKLLKQLLLIMSACFLVGVSQDFNEVHKWCNLSAAQGNETAKISPARFWARIQCYAESSFLNITSSV